MLSPNHGDNGVIGAACGLTARFVRPWASFFLPQKFVVIKVTVL
jgi:hypothetical protein